MQKRLFGLLVGIALLTTLCMNVLAAYADPSFKEDFIPSLNESLQTETPESALTTDIFDNAYHVLAVDSLMTTPTQEATSQLLVNGLAVENGKTKMINNTTYVSLRSIVSTLFPQATITWEYGQVFANGPGFSLSARPGDVYMVVNERYLYVPTGILWDDGTISVPIRTLCTALGASTHWEMMTGTITVTTTGAPITHGSSYYNSDDLYWLSRIITAESRNQPLSGKIAVGSVIMNRVESPKFPNTVHAVIFSGIQFSPVHDGSIYNEPNEESVIASKLVLDGAREAQDSLFFNRAGLNSWASRAKTYITTIADHSFYR